MLGNARRRCFQGDRLSAFRHCETHQDRGETGVGEIAAWLCVDLIGDTCREVGDVLDVCNAGERHDRRREGLRFEAAEDRSRQGRETLRCDLVGPKAVIEGGQLRIAVGILDQALQAFGFDVGLQERSSQLTNDFGIDRAVDVNGGTR